MGGLSREWELGLLRELILIWKSENMGRSCNGSFLFFYFFYIITFMPDHVWVNKVLWYLISHFLPLSLSRSVCLSVCLSVSVFLKPSSLSGAAGCCCRTGA